MITISAVLCYKDDSEIEFLECCIAHFRPFVTECVVVVEPDRYEMAIPIFEKYDCKITEFIFENNFSDMRNAGIEASTGEWILTIDVDEFFEHRLLYNLQYMLENIEYDGIAFRRINWVENKLRPKSYPDWRCRIFKKEYRYFKAVHEHVDIPEENIFREGNYHLIHIKNLKRQKNQRSRYKKLRGMKIEKTTKINK